MAGRLRAEFWTLPSSEEFKKICDLPILAGSGGTRELSAWTDGTFYIPSSSPELEKVRPSDNLGMVRVFDGPYVVDEYLVERLSEPEARPGQVQISGRQFNGVMEKLLVYPFGYPLDHVEAQDWIWDGQNILPSLKLIDLGNINEVWEVYLSGERYELEITSEGGTYTLAIDEEETEELDWDASASQIQSALEDLDGINEVTVLRPDPDRLEFIIVFENPKNLPTDLTREGGDAVLSLTKLNDGFDTGSNPTFTITVDGETTEAFAWNASAATIEGVSEGLTPPGSGLQGLPNIQDVTVSGSGVAGDPWVITFYNPPAIGSLSVSFAAGTAVVDKTQEGLFDPSPITQSKFADNRVDETLHGEYGEPPIEVITDEGHLNDDFDDSEWTLLVRARGQFAGSQLLQGVTPYQTYQAGIPVKVTVPGRYRLVIRDVLENLIKWTSPSEVFIPADGAYHWLEIPDITIPAGVDIANMRVAVVSADGSEIANFYADWQHAYLIEGMPRATWTQIVRTLLQAGQARGAFEWLDWDFTDTHDSAGNELEPISYTAFVWMTLAQVLSDGDGLGYKWRVVPKDTPADGKTHDLQIFYQGEVEDLTASSGAPVVRAGTIEDGSVVSRAPDFSVGVGWGLEGEYVELEHHPISDSGLGRFERVFDVERVGRAAILSAVIEKFREQELNASALTARVRGDAQRVPFIDYAEGSKIWWEFPGKQEKIAKPISRVTWSIVDNTGLARYDLAGSRVFADARAGLARAVNKLLSEYKVRRRRREFPRLLPSGGGGIPDVVVAASNTKFKEDADLVCPGNGLDHLTIRQALDRLPSSGGWVHLLEGDYENSDNVDVQIGGDRVVRVTGAGMNLTRIKLAGGVTVDSVFRITTPTPGGAAIFEDLTINGNKSAGTSAVSMIRVVQQASSPTVYLNRVRVVDSPGIGIGSTVRTGGYWRFHQVRVEGSVGVGVQLGETSSVHTDCRYTGNGGDGFNAGALGHVHQFIGCRIDNNGDDGIEHSGALAGARIVVVGCAIHGNGGDGVVIGQFAPGGIVVGNQIYNNSAQSVASNNSQTVVLGNHIAGNGTNAPTPDHGNMVGGTWTGSGSGVTDHGDLDGLEDDDHTQYLTEGRHDAHDHSTALGTASIGDLADVDLSTPPNDGEALVWDSGASAFVPSEVAAPDIGGAYAETIGDGSSTSFPVEHNLGTEDVVVQLWDLTGMVPVLATDDADSIEVTDENTVTVNFSGAPAIDSYRVVIVAGGSEGGGGSGTDEDAIHLSEAGEINSLDSVTPADNDVLLIEDASDGYTKKKVLAGSLGGGGGGIAAISDLPNLVGWWDADDSATVSLDGSGNVQTWEDKSDSGADASQATSGSRPPTITLNGRTWIDFSTGNHYLSTTGPTPVRAAKTLFVVLYLPYAAHTGKGRRGFLESYDQYFQGGLEIAAADSNVLTAHTNDGSLRSAVDSTAFPLQDPVVVCAEFQVGAGVYLYRDNSPVGAISVGNISQTSFTGYRIGTYRDANDRWFDGYIGEIVMIDGILDAVTRSAVFDLLAAKWT